MKNTEELDTQLINFISGGINKEYDNKFEQLALELFLYQFSHNQIYQYYCKKINRTPKTIRGWTDIPAIHTSAFKEAHLSCTPLDTNTYFETSGTSSSKRGRHYLDSRKIYQYSLKNIFKSYCMPHEDKMPMFILFPSFEELPHSSLAYMFHVLSQDYGTNDSQYYFLNGQLQYDTLIKDLTNFTEKGQALMLLGTTLSFVQLFKQMSKEIFQLPRHTRLIDTGGRKGRTHDVSRDTFHKLCEKHLGIHSQQVINEYGMTEMGSQFYDCTFSDHLHHKKRARQKIPAPWVRTQVISANGSDEASIGETGLLRHFDLANRNSVLAIQTEDIAVRTEDGFEILGRPHRSEPRGCSLTIEDFL